MSSPTSLAPLSGPGATTRGAGRSRDGDRGEPAAFGTALRHALAGDRAPDRPATAPPATGPGPEDGAPAVPTGPAADADGTEEPPVTQPTAAVADLPPGLWALLAGATGPAGTAAGGPPAGEVPPGHAAPSVPALPAAGPASPMIPGAPAPAAATAPSAGRRAPAATEALARAAGLSVVHADGRATGASAPEVAAVPASAGPTPGPTASAPVPADAADPTAAMPTAAVPVPADAADPTVAVRVVAVRDAAVPVPADAAAVLPSDAPDPAGPRDTAGGIDRGAPRVADPGGVEHDLGTVPVGQSPAAATPATPATPAAPVAVPRETPVATQLAPHLAVLRNAPDGSSTMTVVLTPESLGEVVIQVTITDGTLDLTLRGGSEHGRHALADALPELRRDLESSGLSFSRMTVDPDVPRDGGPGGRTAEQLLADPRGDRSGQPQGGQHQGPARSRWGSPGPVTDDTGPAPLAHPSASSGVDVRV